MKIHLHIDKIVVRDMQLGTRSSEAFRQSVTQALAEQLTSTGLSHQFSRGGATEQVRGGDLSIEDGGRLAARSLAASIYSELGG